MAGAQHRAYHRVFTIGHKVVCHKAQNLKKTV
jgi:hypothetical protein